MTEKSYLWTTGETGDGAATYSREDWQQIAQIFASCHSNEGIAPSFRNAFAGTANPGNSSDRTVRIAAGGAVVDGKPYDSNANVDIVLDATPSNRRDRIVLRTNWTTQTVRIYVIKGMDGSDTPPAITQTSQSLYDITLYQAALTSGGTVTLTDERAFARIGRADIVPTETIPIGCILLWSGSVSSIPSGWALCNGSNGTPDLRNRFIIGAGSTYAVNATGGSTTKNLAHTHTQEATGSESSHTHTQVNTGSESRHTHTQGNTGNESSHTHLVEGLTAVGGTGSGGAGNFYSIIEGSTQHIHALSITSNAGSSHSHTNPTTNAGSAHSHSNPTTNAGSPHSHTNPTTDSALSATQDIMPPYYALAYIMKVA